ncbi:MAG: hypothetical protein J1E82_08745 [Muribaculaceae bacterium]|nr:hypothetical protein [Muribaculaceae bacterium]
MKKFLYLASATALLASCSDDFNTGNNSSVLEGKTKITANLNVGEENNTRTSVEIQNGQYALLWNRGDALGIYGATSEQYVTNADFYYAGLSSSTAGEFYGDITVVPGDDYVGYYPYNPTGGVVDLGDGTTTTINLSINAEQTFNAKATAQEWNNNKANGSFANGTVPAYGFATAVAGEDGGEATINFDFQTPASFIAVPVVGTEVVNTLTLKISTSETGDNISDGYYYLSGDVTVTLTEADDETTVTYPSESSENKGTSVTLNCGNYQLSTEDATNFWFVVPAGINLQGSTIELYFNGDDENPLTRTFPDTWTSSSKFGTFTGANDVRWIGQSAIQGDYFKYAGDKYMITSPQAFLEYCYLVSNQDVYKNYYQYFNNLPGTEIGQMVNITSGEGAEADITVKPAYIVGELDFTNGQSTIESWLKGINPYYSTNPYYMAVFGEYIKNGYISTIGGAQTYTITGAAPATSTEDEPAATAETSNPSVLKGLKVNGNQLFVSNGETSTVSNITLNNVVLNATEFEGYYAYLSVYKSNLLVQNVTVNGTTDILLQPSSSEAENDWLFYNFSSSYFENNSVSYEVEGTNIDEMIFANNLNINTRSFNFVEVQPVSAFNNINIIQSQWSNPEGYGALLTIKDAGVIGVNPVAVDLMERINNNGFPYSVVDSKTSYWTGTYATTSGYNGWIANGTAERLATLLNTVLNGSSIKEYTFSFGDYNLNLMGTYLNTEGEEEHKCWTNNGVWGNTLTVNASETANTISNVYINGYKDYEPAETEGAVTLILTTLGGYTIIPEEVVINDVTINCTRNQAFVAAVSASPKGESTVTVNNYQVNWGKGITSVGQEGYVNGVGGLYQNLDGENINYVVDSNYSNGNTNANSLRPTTAFGGIVAGVLNYSVENSFNQAAASKNPLTIPYVGVGSPSFGVVNITVSMTTASANSSYIVINSDYNSENWMNWNFIAGANISTTTNSLYVIYNGKKYVNSTIVNGKFSPTGWEQVGQ